MNNLPEYSAIAVIVVFLIKEMFSYMKEKKKESITDNVNKTDTEHGIDIARIEERLDKIQTLSSNHIAHIQDDIVLIRKDIEKICENIEKIRDK